MNAIQRDYMQAKAMRDMLYARKRELMKDYHLSPGTEDEQNSEKYTDSEIEIDRQLGITDTERHLLEAETNLFAWVRDELKRSARKHKHYHEVLGMFKQNLSPAQREKLADICVQLKAS